MPSGAKKRKAAKKKKEIESSTSTNNNPHGENELKSIDEKGSDGGEVDSPRDHDEDHNQFNEGSDEVEEVEPLVAVVKSTEEVRNDSKVDEAEGGKEGVDVIEWDMKSDESSENKDVRVVRIESDEGLNNGSGNSGVTSNDVIETGTAKNLKDEPYNDSVKETVAFDEEAVNSVKEGVVETGTAKNLKDESYNDNISVKETAAFDEEAVNSVKEGVNSAAESSAGSVNVVNSVSEVQSEDTGNGLLEKSLGFQGGEADLDAKRNEDKVHVLPDENVKTSSLEEPVTREFDGKVSSSPVSQGAETDLAGKRIEDKVHVLPYDNVQTSSLEEPETKEFDGKVSSSPVSQSPITESTNGAERVKDSNTAECSENQPPAASAPLLVQKTSWLSCCGLFEALSSSNR
ncbi:hypothetical protein RYX36_005127 [Vicia faba]